MPKFSKIKKIVSIIILIFAFSLTFPTKTKAQTTNGRFFLSPSSGSFTQGCESQVHININTGSNTSNAANIYVNYNPSQVDIIDSDPTLPGIQIATGDAYGSYADNIVNTGSGVIRLTGVALEGFSGTARFGTILFQSKAGVTSSSFSISFTGVGNTHDSNIAHMTTSNDVLGSVGNGSYSFVSGSCFDDTTPPSIEPISPKNYDNDVPLDSNVSVTICDTGAGVDIESVIISILGEDYTYEDSASFSYQTSGSCFTITIDPQDPFPEDTPIFVVYKASDFMDNAAMSYILFNIPYDQTTCAEQVIKELEECEQEKEECEADFTVCRETIIDEITRPTKGLIYLPLSGAAQVTFRSTLNISSIALALISLLLAFPSLFVKREKKPWGIVYDSRTRKPVAFATVRIYQEGKLKDQKVTDMEGRYGFIVEDGRYVIEVQHGNFEKVSVQHAVNRAEPGIHLDIGLTPLAKKKVSFSYQVREKLANSRELYKRIASYTFSVGFILSLVALLERPTFFNQLVIAMYLVAGIIYALIELRKKAGRVISTATQKGIAYASVRIFDAKDRKLVDNQMTDIKGRYSFIVSPGKYLLHASMPGYTFPSVEQTEDIKRVFFGSVIEIDVSKKKTLSIDLYMDPLTQEKFQLLQEEAQKAKKGRPEKPQEAQLRSPFSGGEVLP